MRTWRNDTGKPVSRFNDHSGRRVPSRTVGCEPELSKVSFWQINSAHLRIAYLPAICYGIFNTTVVLLTIIFTTKNDDEKSSTSRLAWIGAVAILLSSVVLPLFISAVAGWRFRNIYSGGICGFYVGVSTLAVNFLFAFSVGIGNILVMLCGSILLLFAACVFFGVGGAAVRHWQDNR